MAAVGSKSFLVKLIHAKTKIKIAEITEMLSILPECLAESFIEANSPVYKKVNLGIASAYWRTGRWGPFVKMKGSDTFTRTILRLKQEQEYPLAKTMWDLMPDITKHRILARVARGEPTTSQQIARESKQLKVLIRPAKERKATLEQIAARKIEQEQRIMVIKDRLDKKMKKIEAK